MLVRADASAVVLNADSSPSSCQNGRLYDVAIQVSVGSEEEYCLKKLKNSKVTLPDIIYTIPKEWQLKYEA